ncbi:putative beta-galactosidase E [Talaromyces atroroseus]|uniref:Beta-galactosidase n=1 Tax=Talaromyces atroroseus TaxID=1441469 RepID=A0A1Q5Q7H3_TALAT|nr:putative beta-galactosidase E [Talaromyces atroroseus]OKL55621.1 putative beta-galactosidase E [Talaromyces atroroseus]
MRFSSSLLLSALGWCLCCGGSNSRQDLVTWDEHSFFVRGERLMIFSGEFHPFRLPVPGLWLDVFQKIKSMGFTGVSFYTDWALLEGNPGHVVIGSGGGIWDLEEFFSAATEAGIYLIARPGPYINAEVSAGGIPGWVLRSSNATLRSLDPGYLETTQNYVPTIGKIISKAQITKGGPVILLQPENEYTSWPGLGVSTFPGEMNREYMAFVERQFRDAGIQVPFIVNDNLVEGYFAPGSGLGAVDIYGIDSYPMRYDCRGPNHWLCADPYVWPTYRFPYTWQATHQKESPTTPFSIAEFQGGSGEGWGGVVEEMCADLVNMETARVVYKNNYSFGVKLFNIYMTYGGTNWGNLGYMNGYTSYDYGAAISEDRSLRREKYSEQKLQANFLKVSPAYLTATSVVGMNGTYGAPETIAVTPLLGDNNGTNFYVVRHADFTSLNTTQYTLDLSTSIGSVTIPQLGGSLALSGRDSKIHVTDYDLGGINLIYSSAEILTWARGEDRKRTAVLYGGEEELHEIALPASLGQPSVIEGSGVAIRQRGSAWVLQWRVTPERKIVQIGPLLELYLVWRNEAYNYWVMELTAPSPVANFTSPSKDLVVVKAGYLIRSAEIEGDKLKLTGDVNQTTVVELISSPKDNIRSLTFNGELVKTTTLACNGKVIGEIEYKPPSVEIPRLSSLTWRYLDSVPEIKSTYNDASWTECNKTITNNPTPFKTPRDLYALDYGFHTGSLIYRGRFLANAQESTLSLNISGGTGFANIVWLNDVFLGSFPGSSTAQVLAQNFTFPHPLTSGKEYILTVLIDNMGQDEEGPGTDAIKFPHGILNYSLAGHDDQSDVTWKMTGNLGGEQYRDLARGPLNEGALYAERQGYHYPQPPASNWTVSSPVEDGLAAPGVGFYTTSFRLDIPSGWDVPMSFVFNNGSDAAKSPSQNYRCLIFVNGYQFGKYINNLGPQTTYPVPEGILNYNGDNFIAVTLWAMDTDGAKLAGLDLVPTAVIKSGYSRPALAPQPTWTLRDGAY